MYKRSKYNIDLLTLLTVQQRRSFTNDHIWHMTAKPELNHLLVDLFMKGLIPSMSSLRAMLQSLLRDARYLAKSFDNLHWTTTIEINIRFDLNIMSLFLVYQVKINYSVTCWENISTVQSITPKKM